MVLAEGQAIVTLRDVFHNHEQLLRVGRVHHFVKANNIRVIHLLHDCNLGEYELQHGGGGGEVDVVVG